MYVCVHWARDTVQLCVQNGVTFHKVSSSINPILDIASFVFLSVNVVNYPLLWLLRFDLCYNFFIVTLMFVNVTSQVDTYGSMQREEKVRFVLEQMRLCLAKKDFVRAQIVSKKISTKFFTESESDEVQASHFVFMHVCTHTHAHTRTCAHTHARAHTHTHARACTHTHTRTCLCKYVCIYSMYICTCACIHACTHIRRLEYFSCTYACMIVCG